MSGVWYCYTDRAMSWVDLKASYAINSECITRVAE